jgi:hypothetical protein
MLSTNNRHLTGYPRKIDKMKSRIQKLLLLTCNLLIAAAISSQGVGYAQENTQQDPSDSTKTTTEVRLASEIQWQKLNPARGEASPQAGTIWGVWFSCEIR